jgi:hypothetical protein
MKKGTGLLEEYFQERFTPGLNIEIKYLSIGGFPCIEVWESGELTSSLAGSEQTDDYEEISNMVIHQIEISIMLG